MDPPNICPFEGEVYYISDLFDGEEASGLMEQLTEEINWKSYKIKMFGKSVVQPRMTAWYADPHINYTYSGTKMEHNHWCPNLEQIKSYLEKFCNEKFNSALLNLYRDQKDYMGFHSDDETELGQEPFIASVSFGQKRILKFQHKAIENANFSLELDSGSLLIMKGKTQKFWKHSLVKSTKPLKPRINITYRYTFSY